MMNDKTRGTIEMSAAMAVSGTIGWFVLESGRPAIEVVFWRCLFGAATLLAICAAMGHLRHLTRRVLVLAGLGGAAIVVNWLLLFAAYPRASISIATAVYNTQPFMLVGLGRLFLGERPPTVKLAWMGLAFAGVLAIVEAGPDAGAPGADYFGGIALSLGAAFFYALAALVAKKLAGTPPHLIALIQVCVGLALTAPFAHLTELPGGWTSWSCLAAIGVVHTGLVYILLYGGIQKLPTALSGALSFIYPAVAILVDVTALGHRPQAGQILGMAAVLAAAAGATFGWTPIRARLSRRA
jgi:drug/metabolite transporter (DMT)-like permease